MIAELDLDRRHVGLQRLEVGVRCHELDAVQVTGNHGVDGVAAATTYAEDQDLGVRKLFEFE